MLRWSLRRLKLVSEHPYRDFVQLLWPFPRRWPCTLPRPPRALFADPEVVEKYYYRYSHVQRQLPLWARRDTPQRAFFRLYEAIGAADDVMIGYATEYLFFRPEPEWALHRLPDPREMPGAVAPSSTDSAQEDAERLAVMARLAVSLEEAFNWRLELGLRRDGTVVERSLDGTPAPWEPEARPSWADEIPGIPEMMVLSRNWVRGNLPVGWKPRYNIVLQGGALRTV